MPVFTNTNTQFQILINAKTKFWGSQQVKMGHFSQILDNGKGS